MRGGHNYQVAVAAWYDVGDCWCSICQAAFAAHAASEMKRLRPDCHHVHVMDFCKEWDETWADN